MVMAAREREWKSNAVHQSWQDTLHGEKGLHWEEIIEVVKKQHFAFECAQLRLPAAQESVHYSALIFFICLLAWCMCIHHHLSVL